MGSFRLPGSYNQVERFLRVEDGTLAQTPMPWQGPIGRIANGCCSQAAPTAKEEREAFVAQNAGLWDQILSGKLERNAALRKVVADAEDTFALGMNTPLARGLLQEVQRQVPPYVVVRRPEQALWYLPSVQRPLYVLQVLFEIYDQLCQEEFAQLKRLQADFNNPIAYLGIKFKDPWQYYQWLRPYYYRAGMTDPVAALSEIEPAQFLGRPVIGGVNQQMKKILRDAEQELDRTGARQAVAQAIRSDPSGFVPRPINTPKGLTDLSNHALGQAVDIEPATNPDIQGTAAKDIDEVLAYLKVPYRFRESFLEAQNLAPKPEEQVASAYQKVKAISDAIQGFLRDWFDVWDAWEAERLRDTARLEELQKLEQKQRAVRDQSIGMEKSYVRFLEESKKLRSSTLETWRQGNLIERHGDFFKDHEEPLIYIEILVRALGGMAAARLYRAKGLVTLPLQLFVAMKKAGARVGALDYETKKDIMHFEVPPAAPKRGAK
jgi:hypothetical protein